MSISAPTVCRKALGRARGPFLLQAWIASCHARAPTADATDWPQIAALYGELAALVRSPIVELNRAVAVSMAEEPATGLVLLDALSVEPALQGYHLLWAARAAQREFQHAAALTQNARQRTRLLARAAACARESTAR